MFEEGSFYLSNAIKQNTTIKILVIRGTFQNIFSICILGDNTIQSSGMKHISESLKINSSITTFELGNHFNLINHSLLERVPLLPKGCLYLSESLKINTSITHFSLKGKLIFI
jgi:hypothetical protein